ncbi:MAG: hypothetical protein WA962_02455, partial [Ornithinimicrobium sp.]
MLIFGGANTGKTVYVIQLYGRLADENARLKLRYQPDDLSLIVAGFDRLSNGLPPEHTTTGANADVTLPVTGPDGRAFDIVYPDYAGEQVDDMVNKRQVTAEWRSRVLAAPTWLVFLRLDRIHDPKDVVTSPPASDAPAANGGPSTPSALGDQAETVEALQLLLHVAGVGSIEPVRRPVLAVVLSCWDELSIPEGTPPQSVLKERFPLVEAFIRSNWHPFHTIVYGLSAQGKPLQPDAPDDEFIDQGPESMGYVVCPDGSHDADLTLLLHDALDRTP